MAIIIRDKDGETAEKVKDIILPEYKEKEVKNKDGKPIKNVSKVIRHLIDKEIESIKNQ